MSLKAFANGSLCKGGQLVREPLVISPDSGEIVSSQLFNQIPEKDVVDVTGQVIAPGFLELQTNGMNGFHFTDYVNAEDYGRGLEQVANFLVSKGVTSFWATLPTVAQDQYQKILPNLNPKQFDGSASLLGAHVEGPYLAASKKGAHTAKLFHQPGDISLKTLYGEAELQRSIKLVTIAPELPGSSALTSTLSQEYDIRVALGHSSATYDEGLTALKCGASGLTHVFNAMNPLHHREPGLAGLMSLRKRPIYYSVIPDGIHLHPATLSLAFRLNPARCMLITDSIELAGLGDGTYPGNAQIATHQVKKGNKVVMEGEDTLIGSCLTLDEGVRNLVKWSGCSLVEGVRCVTENIANFMGLTDRGSLDPGKRADFVVLDSCTPATTWIGGRQVWPR